MKNNICLQIKLGRSIEIATTEHLETKVYVLACEIQAEARNACRSTESLQVHMKRLKKLVK